MTNTIAWGFMIDRTLASLFQPVFTVYMTNVGAQISQGGGQLTVGNYDQQNCGTNINWIPLTSQSYWQFKLDR